jgi:hypothetical protein
MTRSSRTYPVAEAPLAEDWNSEGDAACDDL